jgi:hypothetical protein
MRLRRNTLLKGLWATIFIVAIPVACNELRNTFASGINFKNPEEVTTLSALLNKHITEDMIVQEIEFDYSESRNSFSFVKDEATIVYVDPNDHTINHGIEVNLKTGKYGPDQWLEDHRRPNTQALQGVKLGKFDYSRIAPIINAAIQAMKDENIETHGIGSFRINFRSGDINDYHYAFTLQHRTGSTHVGRTERISYEDYKFTADKDGNLDFE